MWPTVAAEAIVGTVATVTTVTVMAATIEAIEAMPTVVVDGGGPYRTASANRTAAIEVYFQRPPTWRPLSYRVDSFIGHDWLIAASRISRRDCSVVVPEMRTCFIGRVRRELGSKSKIPKHLSQPG